LPFQEQQRMLLFSFRRRKPGWHLPKMRPGNN
jgi:hypothetical protein